MSGTPRIERRTFRMTVIVLLGSVPGTLLITLAMMPVWNWIESAFAIESVGHSGPANWCFITVWIAFVAAGLLLIRRGLRPGGLLTRPPLK